MPLAAVILLCLVVAVVVSSCVIDEGGLVPPVQPPPFAGGVPVVRVLLTAAPIDSATLEPGPGARFLVDDQVVKGPWAAGSRLQVSRSGKTWRLNQTEVRGDDLALASAGGGYSKFNGAGYRGTLLLHPQGAEQFVVINHVDMESYLAGVLRGELYANWSAETYRALAIAARTFALYHKEHFGAAGHDHDLGDNQASQMYGGVATETSKSWQAVRESNGIVLAYARPGQRPEIFMAQYSASNGGTVNGAYVIRDAERIKPLEGGQADPDGASCPHWRWPDVKVTKAELHKALQASGYTSAAALANVKEIRVADQTPYGRMIWLDVLDSAGHSVRLRAEDLRLVLLRRGPSSANGLYSMNCRIREAPSPDGGGAFVFCEGKGFGHGVGLSQWGAQDKAARGVKAEQILQFYYPGAVLVRKY